ncbi:hypothetical protein J3R82DRAFT_3191 [Butyriboletus roseoflavus]|nr:hypothetical protein J3R82DRAFT_3191 [Butyriboletus roseoflavus]
MGNGSKLHILFPSVSISLPTNPTARPSVRKTSAVYLLLPEPNCSRVDRRINTQQNILEHIPTCHTTSTGGSTLLIAPCRHPAAISSAGFPCRWCTGDIPCTQAFLEFDDLIVHLRQAHDVQGKADRKLDCQWLMNTGYCGKKQLRRDGFKRHIATHIGLSVTCTECNKSFSREDTLREHKKDHAKK